MRNTLKPNEIIIKQRNLPPNVLYRWHYPHLTIPMNCTLEKLNQIIALFESETMKKEA